MFARAVAALRRPRLGPALLTALHLAALALFIHGFLLTRVHLSERSTAAPTAAAAGAGSADDSNRTAPYDRVVWLMIDALRYDMVISDGRYTCGAQQQQQAGGSICHQGHMPFLAGLTRRQDAAARSFMFVADAPTTTTQRLKSLATGGLPSFFDVSNSFTAGEVTDDNLLAQLATAGKRMAFLGDTTWQQLFPSAWAWSRPYPCFNVRDLHTVDDGVWAHLLPALRQPGAADCQPGVTTCQPGADSWDGLLVAHYLGVDHCGHTHGVGSQEMADKLRQMDDHVRQVVGALLEQAAPGGTHERALLLVSGDHGQTLGGDHGGGSPEEVDSALVAVDIGALYRSDIQNKNKDGASGGNSGSGDSGAGMQGTEPAPAAVTGGLAAPAPCRTDCTCGLERNQCAPDLLQTDLTPTLAALLGVPIPFGNLGKASAELWQLTAGRSMHSSSSAAGAAGAAGGSGATEAGVGASVAAEGGGAPAAADAWERSLAEVLLANARQVHTYLNTYAATAGASFSRAALTALNDQYKGLPDQSAADVGATIARCNSYLEAAAAVAREQWTQFNEPAMLAGLVLFAATLALHAAAAFGGTLAAPASGTDGQAGGAVSSGGWMAAVRRHLQERQLVGSVGRWRLPVPTFRSWLALAALVHGLGVFSFFYLLSEGRMVCILVGTAGIALALAAGRASRAAGKPLRGVVGMGVMSLRCNALMAVLGVAHHTGQGFWARLTVHEPQPAGDVERGWHGKLAKAKAFGAAVMAAAGADRLPPMVLLVAQHSLLCTLPILALAAATERLQRGSRRSALHRLLQLASFASVAAYHQAEDATKHGLLPKEGLTLSLLWYQHLAHLLPAQLSSRLAEVAYTVAQPALAAWPAASQLGAHALSLPLLAVLPHVTYVLCAVLAALWLAQAATRRLRGAAAATAAAQLVLPALLQVSDRQAPLILLLALAEVMAIARLLARRAELLPAGSGAGAAGEAGVLLALVASQLFYVTGHLCEFAGLQYTAGFVGFEQFRLWRSGTLLALNTFGGMLLALLALPAVVEHVHAAPSAAAAAVAAAPGDADSTKQAAPAPAAAGQARDEQSSQAEPASAAAALQQAVLVAGLVQAVSAFCATLSAGVQRRHLYAWALFAPRFSFAALMLLLSDFALALLALLD